jgi:hypothetical protein
MPKNNHDGEGKSPHSYIKHRAIDRFASGQVASFRRSHPHARMLLIDGNAGDGMGVEIPLPYPFENDRIKRETSRPTAGLLADLANDHNADLCLCDKDKEKRQILKEYFPEAHIFSTHEEVVQFAIAQRPDYAIWLSDPCGPAGHGVEYMRELAMYVRYTDFVIILNEHACSRFAGVAHSPYWQAHQIYPPMVEASWWSEKLPKRFQLRTIPERTSGNFCYRLIVLTDYLCEGARRQPDIEQIINR